MKKKLGLFACDRVDGYAFRLPPRPISATNSPKNTARQDAIGGSRINIGIAAVLELVGILILVIPQNWLVGILPPHRLPLGICFVIGSALFGLLAYVRLRCLRSKKLF